MSKDNKQLALAEQAKAADKVIETALSVLGGTGSMENSLQVATAMNDLTNAITPEMMVQFMQLQNTALGFKTDRDVKSGKSPYAEAVVKECVIEATLRGVQVVGNQFNILAGRCYITKEGFEYKLKKLDGLAAFKPNIGIPRMVNGGAVVTCTGTWLFKNKPDSLSCDIAIRVNEGMGSDAVVGKAQRKFYKRVFEQITGTSIPDGEVGDEPLLKTPANVTVPRLHQQTGAVEEKAPLPETPERDAYTDLLQNMATSGVSLEELSKYLVSHEQIQEPLKDVRDLSADAVDRLNVAWAQHVRRIIKVRPAAADPK